MTDIVTPWAVFIVSAVSIVAAGYRLARDGDTISKITGLGGMWVGAILVAGATSLPELVTDINAVLQGRPSLAVGDLFGSNMANMMILAVAVLFTRRTRILTRVAINQALIGALAIGLTAVAIIGMAIDPRFGLGVLGPATLIIAVGYLGGMSIIHRNREEPRLSTNDDTGKTRLSRERLPAPALRFAVASIVILVAAPYLAESTSQIAVRIGIADSFAGLLLLALITSIPEAAVSIASIRAGAYQLAVGNLFGSNCINMAALVPLDIVHGGSGILGDVSRELALGGLFAIVLMTLAMMDVLNKSKRRVWIIEPMPTVILLTYFAGLWTMYLLTTP